MRIHLLALPNASTTKAFSLDGFSQMTIRIADLLKRLGHYVMLYGGEQNEAPCDEHIICISDAERLAYIPPTMYQNALMTHENPLWKLVNPRLIVEIGKRKQPRDLIFTIGGNSQKQVTDAHQDLMDVEYSIGYEGNYARYRVYESSAWQHHCYGMQSIKSVRFYDAVIPGFLDETKEKFVAKPQPYVAYVGRLVPRKGIKIACEAAKLAGVPLKIVGHGLTELVTYGEYLGALDNAGRDEVLMNASAVYCPTCYIEPFNYVGIEAQMHGTPVISTDQGGFVETVEHGVSGLRCSTLGEFVKATKAAVDGGFDRQEIRDRAVRLYGMETAKENYSAYLSRLDTIWDKGWNTL